MDKPIKRYTYYTEYDAPSPYAAMREDKDGEYIQLTPEVEKALARSELFEDLVNELEQYINLLDGEFCKSDESLNNLLTNSITSPDSDLPKSIHNNSLVLL